MKIIAISGHAQNGKDTFAGMLKEEYEVSMKRVLIAHYADLVKYICKTFFDWDGKKDERGRHLLQYIGTDVVRAECPDYWVNFIIDMMKFFGSHWDYVIIPDTRFPNEVERLRESCFDVLHLKIVRPNFESPLTPEQQNHPSETSLDNYPCDFTITNTGLDDLKREAITVVNNY